MEESKKKVVKLGIIVGCLVLAGAVFVMTRTTTSGLDSVKRGTMIWVKCRNPECDAAYQIDQKDYFQFCEENIVGPIAPPMPCEECGEDSAYRAEKCEKCELVFELGSVPREYADKCPDCGYSKSEEKIRLRSEAREREREEE